MFSHTDLWVAIRQGLSTSQSTPAEAPAPDDPLTPRERAMAEVIARQAAIIGRLEERLALRAALASEPTASARLDGAKREGVPTLADGTCALCYGRRKDGWGYWCKCQRTPEREGDGGGMGEGGG